MGWTHNGVYTILANPKYTGYMVFGRNKTTGGKRRRTAPDQWLWSPEPAHPALITRELFDTAQGIAQQHSTSRDGYDAPAPDRRTYLLRSRIRCRLDGRRMTGTTPHATGNIAEPVTYYACPHRAGNPRHAAACPDHPAGVLVREDILLAAVRQFFDERVFGPERAELLAARYPATPADAAAQRAAETARIEKRVRQIDAAEDGHTRELEDLRTTDAPASAVTALRTRILARFTQLEDERAALTTQLDALAAPADDPAATAALLDAIPSLAGLLADAPARLQQQLYDAFGLELLYNRPDHQVTIRATLTASTPAAVAAITADHHHQAAATPDSGAHLSPTPGAWTNSTAPGVRNGCYWWGMSAGVSADSGPTASAGLASTQRTSMPAARRTSSPSRTE
jgi:site-specific DNA recombinase